MTGDITVARGLPPRGRRARPRGSCCARPPPADSTTANSQPTRRGCRRPGCAAEDRGGAQLYRQARGSCRCRGHCPRPGNVGCQLSGAGHGDCGGGPLSVARRRCQCDSEYAGQRARVHCGTLLAEAVVATHPGLDGIQKLRRCLIEHSVQPVQQLASFEHPLCNDGPATNKVEDLCRCTVFHDRVAGGCRSLPGIFQAFN